MRKTNRKADKKEMKTMRKIQNIKKKIKTAKRMKNLAIKERNMT